MQRKLGILAVFLVLALPLAAAAEDAPLPPDLALDVAVDETETGSCPAETLFPEEGLGRQAASSCTPYGYLCDPRWVTVVCCPGTNCYSPYPNVPKYCL